MKPEFKTSCLVNVKCLLGECPVWHEQSTTLYWVDIIEKKIFSYNLATTVTQWWQTEEYIGFIVFTGGGEMLAGYKSGLHKINLLSDHSVHAERIDRIDTATPSVRFNDAIVDDEGGLWACSMDMDNQAALGKYFYYGSDLKRQVVLEKYTVANGPALNNEQDLLYTVETVGNPHRPKGIYRSSIVGRGGVANEQLFIPWKLASYPDGVFTDINGNLWVGEFGGNVIRSFDNDGKLRMEMPLPAWNVTKGSFCKTAENRLFVTSARLQCDEVILEKYPETGGVFLIEGLV